MEKRREVRSKEEWAAWAKKWNKSGISQDKFCKREGLAAATFKKWIYRLRDEGVLAKVKPGERPRKLESRHKMSGLFTPIKVRQLSAEQETPYCEIQFSNGGRITIEEEESLNSFRKIMMAFVLK